MEPGQPENPLVGEVTPPAVPAPELPATPPPTEAQTGPDDGIVARAELQEAASAFAAACQKAVDAGVTPLEVVTIASASLQSIGG